MASDIGEPTTTRPPESSPSRDTGPTAAADFECNICFELAEDPIVTLCGHLFCWPCLYKWLHIHSRSHECPVCKALIQEATLVPLYGRGKTPTDPRLKPVPGLEIPHRPPGQRPATAPPPPNTTAFGLGGFGPMASAGFGSFAASAGLGGLFDQGWHHGGRSVYAQRFSGGFHGGGHHHHHHHHVHEMFHPRRGHEENNFLKTFVLMMGIFVVLIMIL